VTEIFHEGVLRKSGRYPWGSGRNPHQRSMTFLSMVQDLREKGMTDTEIARSFDMSSTDFRTTNTIAKNQKIAKEQTEVLRLKDKDWSNVAIGKRLGIPEATVRARLNTAMQARSEELMNTSEFLKAKITKDAYLDVGLGTEHHIGISKGKLATAVAVLKDQGYVEHRFSEVQPGTGKKTNFKVLTPPGTTYPDVLNNKDRIRSPSGYTEDGGRTFLNIEPPVRVSSKRIEVRYGPDGGAEMDGVIQLRRGVEDLSLGNARYAQVRIAVDKDRYLKGMAMYTDDLPDGVDIRFNTNKKDTGNKIDAMKKMERDANDQVDEDNPFGSIIRQKHFLDSAGNLKLSPLNIVGSENPDGESTSGEEGGWSKWSSKLSSQFLSKQPRELAQEQLDLAYNVKKSDFDEIMTLTNPVVKRKLLESFAETADSSAVHLKAMGLPRTKNHVILPINTLKDDEVYAPWYNDGEIVVLVRHPHGGTFEIPELRVNNKNKEANRVIKQARDAVGINSKVAERLSGADFDGDTVLVIPNGQRKVQTTAPLKELEKFDPKNTYPAYDGMPVMGGGRWNAAKGKVEFEPGKGPNSTKQHLMGDISNLITDMTIQGAPQSEIARAVRHSMVVIDAEKHALNYKQSAEDNGIAQLKRDYQGGVNGGASTLISKAKSQERVNERKLRPASQGGPVDPKTGKLVYVETGNGYTKTQVMKRTGEVRETWIPKKETSTKMAETDDARTLISDPGTKIERIYANHANQLKDLANQARLTAINTLPPKSDKAARLVYKNEVASLRSKLNIAQANAPRERQAVLFAATTTKMKRQSHPNLPADEYRKIERMALAEGRRRAGARKNPIDITPLEWEAIQAGGVTHSMLSDILMHADLEQVRQYALPRQNTVMSDAKLARARNMLANGYDPGDIATALGVAPSTLGSALERG